MKEMNPLNENPLGAEGRYDRGSSPSVMGEAMTSRSRVGSIYEWLPSRSRVPEWPCSHSESLFFHLVRVLIGFAAFSRSSVAIASFGLGSDR